MSRDRDEKYFRTTSLPLAIFLHAKGQQIAGINRLSTSTKKEFAFVLSLHLVELVDKYKFGERSDPELLVSVPLYENARNVLLDRLNGN